MNNIGDNLGHVLSRKMGPLDTLGSTDAGRLWVMKALNPSAPVTCLGMPDTVTSDVIIHNFKQSFMIEVANEVNTPLAAGVAIDVEIDLHAHPVVFADTFIHYRNDNQWDQSFTYMNNQLGESVPGSPTPTGTWANKVQVQTQRYLAKCKAWNTQCMHSRLLYAGYTLEQTAGDQSDQGMLNAGQQAQTPVVEYIMDPVNGGTIQQQYFTNTDFATFDNMNNLPRSLQSVSKAGAYVVLKLDDTYTQFKSQVTPVAVISDMMSLTAVDGSATGTAPAMVLPHMFCQIQPATPGIQLMNTSVGQIHIRGAQPTSCWQLTCRLGFESKPMSSSLFTPFAISSPAFDQLALQMYSNLMLTVEMDAYTADYNIFEWLGRAIRKVAPYIIKSLQGFTSGGLGGAVRGLGNAMGDEEEEIPVAKRRARAAEI